MIPDIQNKYTIHTPVEHLAIHERIILQELFEDNLDKDSLPGLLDKLCQNVMYHVLRAIEYQVWNCPHLHDRKKRALKTCKESVGTDLKQLAERIEEQQKILWSGMLSPEQASRASSVLSSPYSPLKLARDARDTPPQNRPFWVHPPPAYPTALALQAMRHVPAVVAPATVTQGRSEARSPLSTPTGGPPPWAEREGTPPTSSQ
ncbi:hypothetical protein ACOMHN_020634 [Nucella lapillus]